MLGVWTDSKARWQRGVSTVRQCVVDLTGDNILMILILSEQARQDAIKACQEIQQTCKATVGAIDLCDDLAKRGVKINADFRAQVKQSLTDIHAEFSPKGE